MLPFYAERLPTVEINNTFYRMPRTSMLENWVADHAARRSASRSRRRAASRTSARLKAECGRRLGGLPLQEPRLARRQARPGAVPAAAQPQEGPAAARGVSRAAACGPSRGVRVPQRTWFADDVYAALKGAGASLCLSEREDNAPPPLVETAPWGYVRLRLENVFRRRPRAMGASACARPRWQAIYAYFMHEPTAPAYAAALMQGVERIDAMRRAPRAGAADCGARGGDVRRAAAIRAIYEHENEPPESEAWLRERYTQARDAPSGDGSEQWLNWIVRVASGEAIGYVQATVEARPRLRRVRARQPMVGAGACAGGRPRHDGRASRGLRRAASSSRCSRRRNERSRRLLGRLGFVPAALAEVESRRGCNGAT